MTRITIVQPADLTLRDALRVAAIFAAVKLAVDTAIRFGPAVTISGTSGTWAWWTRAAFYWPAHTGHPWERGWINIGVYVHPYAHPWVRPVDQERRSTNES